MQTDGDAAGMRRVARVRADLSSDFATRRDSGLNGCRHRLISRCQGISREHRADLGDGLAVDGRGRVATMKIRTTILFGAIGLLVLTGAWATLSILAARAEQDRAQSADELVASLRLAGRLRRSSDDLTRMARIYVSTGDAKYRDYYQQILAIRNGSAPRPADYGDIFWDQVLSGDRQLADGGEAVPLRELMQRMGFTAKEFELLTQAEDESNELVHLEEVAMNAVAGRFQDIDGAFTRSAPPDLELARGIMFGPRYFMAKGRIMEPIDQFNRQIEDRVRGEMERLHLRSLKLANWQVPIALLTGTCMLAGFFYLRRAVLKPLFALTRDAKDGRARPHVQ